MQQEILIAIYLLSPCIFGFTIIIFFFYLSSSLFSGSCFISSQKGLVLIYPAGVDYINIHALKFFSCICNSTFVNWWDVIPFPEKGSQVGLLDQLEVSEHATISVEKHLCQWAFLLLYFHHCHRQPRNATGRKKPGSQEARKKMRYEWQ